MIFSSIFHDLYIISLQVKIIPLLFELVPLLIDYGVRPLASPSDGYVGALPIGTQFPLVLLLDVDLGLYLPFL